MIFAPIMFVNICTFESPDKWTEKLASKTIMILMFFASHFQFHIKFISHVWMYAVCRMLVYFIYIKHYTYMICTQFTELNEWKFTAFKLVFFCHFLQMTINGQAKNINKIDIHKVIAQRNEYNPIQYFIHDRIQWRRNKYIPKICRSFQKEKKKKRFIISKWNKNININFRLFFFRTKWFNDYIG